MSRVILGAWLVLLAIVSVSLSDYASAQQEGGRGADGADGEDGDAGGAGGRGGEGAYGGRGRYGGEDGGRGDNLFGADEGTSKERRSRKTNTSRLGLSEEAIEAALQEPLKAPMQYEEQPLNEIINELQEVYNLPIVFDRVALDEVAVSPDTEVTINLRNISLRSALNLMLRQQGLEDLTYVVDEEVLLITTEEKANEKLIVQVYQVDDLVNDYSQQPSGNEKNPYSSLVQVIMGSVEYNTWMANESGEGTVQLMQPGMLVVSQTRMVHEKLGALLEKLRQTRKSIDQSTNSDGSGNF
ncbi:MAG: STN domain-containing protein [Bythopirellula sp.]|nr:STN domain-containing protein [Bythopirellula sp.]